MEKCKLIYKNVYRLIILIFILIIFTYGEDDNKYVYSGNIKFDKTFDYRHITNTQNGRLLYKSNAESEMLNKTIFFDKMYLFNLKGIITSIMADEIGKKVKLAQANNSAICFLLDTPGGLVSSVEEIEKIFLNSKIPIIIYISPRGSRAASGGVFLSYASHIIAACKGTHLGAAHPVNILGGKMDSVMTQKIINDIAANIESVSQLRGRNADWGKEAIIHNATLSSENAYSFNIIDLLVDDITALSDTLSHYIVPGGNGKYFGFKKNMVITKLEPNLRYKILSIFNDPNIVYIFLIFALLGIYVEFTHPGAVFPGVVGAFSLLIALYGLTILPGNIIGLLLIALAFILFILEIYIISYGLLTIGGIFSMLLGSLMLFDSAHTGIHVSTFFIVTSVLFVGGFALLLLILVIKAQRHRDEMGMNSMVGKIGKVISTLEPEGQIFVHGEIWKAISSNNERIEQNEKVKVIDSDGLTLIVEKVSK